MSLNESIVEDVALEWFGEQTRIASTLIPAFFQRGKGGKQRGHPAADLAIPEDTRATGKEFCPFLNPVRGGLNP